MTKCMICSNLPLFLRKTRTQVAVVKITVARPSEKVSTSEKKRTATLSYTI